MCGSITGSSVCSIDIPVYLCTSTMQFLTQILCNIVWNQGWWFPQRCFTFENSFHYSRIFCYSRWIGFFQLSEELSWNFAGNCIESLDCFLQFMSMGNLSNFWDLLQFPSSDSWSFSHTEPPFACLEAPQIFYHFCEYCEGCWFPNFLLSLFIIWVEEGRKFFELNLYPATLLKMFISCKSFLIKFFGVT